VTGFLLHEGALACDDVPVEEIARQLGTPVHIYSASLIAARYRALDAAFEGHPHRLHYAIKANSTGALVRHLRELGAGADANSGGEIAVAQRAGFPVEDIIFTGVGKTHAELVQAIDLGVKAINAESPGEVARIADIAAAHGRVARIAVRINPDVDAGSHRHISTGLHINKFGVSVADARAMIHDMLRRPGLDVVGLHMHIGSQVTSAGPLARAADAIADLAQSFLDQGVRLQHLDLGGGLGIAYEPGQAVMSPAEYAAAVLPAVRRTGLALLLEPGRWIVGPAGVLVTEVVDLKQQPGGRWFVIVDAGMTDLIRPALYDAWHAIESVRPRAGSPIRCDVVGPVCETSDTLGANRELPPVGVGDLLAVRDTGAYGAVMASNYNRRPTAAEVMVDGRTWRIVRRRQTVAEMLQWDV
jgi:diaminopimelate decarboxylase